MSWTDVAIQVVSAFCGTLGFGFLFNIRGSKLWWAAGGGMAAWALFLGLGYWIQGEAVRYFIVSICSTLYAELLARRLKTPATTFFIITLVPLIPGGALYHTTTSAFAGDMELFLPRLIHTAELAVALSLGIVVVTAFSRQIFKRREAVAGVDKAKKSC